jgi:hypothetical protein
MVMLPMPFGNDDKQQKTVAGIGGKNFKLCFRVRFVSLENR